MTPRLDMLNILELTSPSRPSQAPGSEPSGAGGMPVTPSGRLG